MKKEVLFLENLVTRQENRSNLRHVSLSLEEGEAVAVTGRDGSGIGLLEEILSGKVRPDEGKFFLNGEEVSLRSEDDAQSKGIFLIRYENAVIPELSVTENLVVLKRFMWKDFWIDVRNNEKKAQEIFDHYGLGISPSGDCRRLTSAQRMELYMCRALLCGAKVLVCRDLGEDFSTRELLELENFVRIIKKEGVSLILLNSDLRKTAPVADEVLILRNGYICYQKSIEDTDFRIVDRHMDIFRADHTVRREDISQEPRITFTGLYPVNYPEIALNAALYPGETTGVFWNNDIVGNLVLQVFSGKLDARGSVTEDGMICSYSSWFRKNRYQVLCMGIHFWETNLFQNLTLEEHLLLRFYHHFSGGRLLNRKVLSVILHDFTEEYQIPASYLKLPPRLLPTGIRNQVAIWMALILPPKLLVLDNPLYNADGRIQQNLLACLEKLKAQKTIILWSNINNSSLKNYCERIYIPGFSNTPADTSDGKDRSR